MTRPSSTEDPLAQLQTAQNISLKMQSGRSIDGKLGRIGMILFASYLALVVNLALLFFGDWSTAQVKLLLLFFVGLSIAVGGFATLTLLAQVAASRYRVLEARLDAYSTTEQVSDVLAKLRSEDFVERVSLSFPEPQRQISRTTIARVTEMVERELCVV